jgi:NAD(P)-dependent dehydrogenase (short-subunit alcohol dehydrogenase family)
MATKYCGKLEGKIALITGGASGIGLATATRFVGEGAHVFITSRHDVDLAAALEAIGENVTGMSGDASKLDDLDRFFAQIEREKGRLDIVFANAGMARFAPLGQITEEHYDALFDINVKALLFTVQKALPLLPDGASIILNASVGSSKGGAAMERLWRYEGRRTFVCPDLDHGLEGTSHSRECGKPGRHRHAGVQRFAGFH